MKILLLTASIFLSANCLHAQQHNYLISSSSAESVFIRDAKITQGTSLVCAIDIQMKEALKGGIAKIDELGNVDWAKLIKIDDREVTYAYDVAERANGNYYVHGLTKDMYDQHAFLIELSPDGKLVKSFNFDLGEIYFYAINKMEILENGDLLFFFSHYDGTSIAKVSADGKLLWGKTISREIQGTGKQPGYDFEVLEDGSIIGSGKSNYHFSVIKLTSSGRVVWDKNVEFGNYAQAKSIKALPNGNFIVSGDYLPEIDGDFTSFIMEISGEEGAPLWAKQFDQFDGSFHYQNLELINDEIHLSLMGNNTPEMNDPEFQNYYVRLNLRGEVLEGYRNGEHYRLADYQRFIHGKTYSMIYGSVYAENSSGVAGMVHTYGKHDLDACYWTKLRISTSALRQSTSVDDAIYSAVNLTFGDALPLTLVDLPLSTEGTCRPVIDESTTSEESNAAAVAAAEEQARLAQEQSMLAENDFMIYPNPNEGIFTIKTTFETVDAMVIDITGKVVYTNALESGDRIDISHVPSGIYLMTVVSGNEKITRRIVIK